MKQTKAQQFWKKLVSQKTLFFMVIPCMVITFIFSYLPLRGWIMAFQNFRPNKGYSGSDFVGFLQFSKLFDSKEFFQTLRNTLAMSSMNLVFGFLFSIGFALLLNEIRLKNFKKLTQIFSYLPHFLSWVIVCSLVMNAVSTGADGIINNLLIGLGILERPILFLGKPEYFWWIVAAANVWKEMGWNSIIYIAAMGGIDSSLYEAAEIDGANRYHKMWHITLPGIRSTIVVILIMNLGWILNAGFEVQYLLGSGMTMDVSRTIDIFTLEYGMKVGNYSLATAAGIFKSVVSITLVSLTNFIAGKFGEDNLF